MPKLTLKYASHTIPTLRSVSHIREILVFMLSIEDRKMFYVKS